MKLDVQRLLDNTIRLQSIPAPTFHEADRATEMEKLFKKVPGLEVTRDRGGNVLARIAGGQGKPLIISAHLDSVFPLDTPLGLRNAGERIYGPGIGDNAIALAALVELAQVLQPRNYPGDIWLAANTGEEGLGNLLGMRAIVDRFGDNPIAYLVLEGIAFGHIYHRALPVRRLRLSVRGKGGHAWIHAGRPSALHYLLRIGAAISKVKLPNHPKTSLNIGQIHGGTSVNSIADLATLDLDLRSEHEHTLDKIDRSVRRCCKLNRWPPSLELNIERIGSRPGGSLALNHPLLQAAIESTRLHAGHKPQLGIGSTDASLPLSLGYPAICIGITHGGGAHSLEEFIEIPPIKSGFAALLDIINRSMKTISPTG
jgi:acetylornithine deacetylase/succinyl-diaminopimelate desuccinylase-like protein